jgi:N-acetyl-anhydromuramyl-L-alanine amidase AmpD
MNYTSRKTTDFIAVHCSATQPKSDIGAPEIKRWHRERGFLDIGYHYVIRRNGVIDAGRPEHAAGAHVVGFNHNSVGVCLVGGINAQGKSENNFTPEQFERLEMLLRTLKDKYPKAVIQGHRDFPQVAKDCPCFDVKKWVAEKGI